MNCPNPKCKKLIDRIKMRSLNIQYLKLENGELTTAIGEFKNQKAKDKTLPIDTFYCPYCDCRLLMIRTRAKAIQILKET